MYPVLIGSRALHYWNPNASIKNDTDWDVISYKNHKGCEVHNPDILNNRSMTGYRSNSAKVILPDGDEAFVMSPLGLAIIKRSHLWRDLSFNKHVIHYHKYGLANELKSKLHIDIVQRDLEIRTNDTMALFPQYQPNLNQTVENFFDDAVIKIFDHDYLHSVVAFYEKPLYTKMQVDKTKAWCEKSMWDCFSHEDKIKCIAEEAMVIALERFIIPSQWKANSKVSFIKSLNKVCTTLCSGWFRDYAIDHYTEVIELFNNQSFELFKVILKGKLNEKYGSISP